MGTSKHVSCVWCRPLSYVQPESLDTGRSSSAEIMSSLWLPVRSSSAAADSDDRISSDSINARKMAVATREGRCLLRIIPARLRLSAQHVRSAGPSKGGRGNPNLSDRLGRMYFCENPHWAGTVGAFQHIDGENFERPQPGGYYKTRENLRGAPGLCRGSLQWVGLCRARGSSSVTWNRREFYAMCDCP